MSEHEAAEPFVHPALFYAGPDEYLAGTVPFIEAGLAAGEPVMVAVPAENLARIRAGLGVDADRVLLHNMQVLRHLVHARPQPYNRCDDLGFLIA